MLSPGQAARTILETLSPLPVECIPLPEALHRVLGTDMRSPIDIPAWDNSAMDGYAARSEDLVAAGGGAPVLEIVETIPAGSFPTKSLGAGTCARIFTGAPLPDGADTVIRQEDTTPLDGARVQITDLRDLGRNVRPRGEDIRRGAVALTAGTLLGPAQLGVLASMAVAEVYVHRKPKVAFLGSGDEIADLDEADAILAGKKIASSNTYTVQAMAQMAGATPLNLGIAQDDPADIRRRLANIFQADMLVTTAGVSVGEHDHMRAALEGAGAEMKFWRLSMRPGAPVGFGMIGTTPWIGLPGNPVSVMVTFELFVRPAIRKLHGLTTLFRRARPVRLMEPVRLAAPLTHFLRVVVEDGPDGPEARLTGPQGSGILTSMARANALLIVPSERDEVAAGTTLDAIPLAEHVHVAEPPFA